MQLFKLQDTIEVLDGERRHICLVLTRFGVEILPMQSASVATRKGRDEHKPTLIGNTLDSHLGAENADWPVKPSSIIGAKFVLVRRFRNHFPSTCDVVGGKLASGSARTSPKFGSLPLDPLRSGQSRELVRIRDSFTSRSVLPARRII